MSQAVAQSESKAERIKPLCVDLDGTLVKSDTLVDSLLVLARTHPLLLFRLPEKVLRGKAQFKSFITENVALDVVHLPYNRTLLRFLQQEHARGREIYLATGADFRLAERVANHLAIFDGVLGSDGVSNLTGNKKLESLRNRLGGNPTDIARREPVMIAELNRATHIPADREDVADEAIGPGDPGDHEHARIRWNDDGITISGHAARCADRSRHPKHRRKAERASDAIGGRVVPGRNQGRVGCPCRVDAFTQAAGRHRPILEILFSDEEQIDVAREFQMLKPIVQ